MFCPECGAETTENQQYCRGCGAGLPGSTERRRAPRAIGVLTILIMLVGLMISMAGKFADARAMVFIGGFIVVLSAVFGVGGTYLYSVYNRRRKKPAAAGPGYEPPIAAAAATTNQLPPVSAADHFTGVTEHTTTRLDARPGPK